MVDRSPAVTAEELAFVAASRRAVLATIDPAGRPRLVPICHAVGPRPDPLGRPVLYSPLDEKPKATADPRNLARVRDLLARPDVSLLVDRWDEDWALLGWVRLSGRGELLEPGPGGAEEHRAAIELLREKYPQYHRHRLEDRPVLRMTIDGSRSWGNLRVG